MPNNSGFYQGNSQKISEFNSQSLIQDTDLFTFVRSATNFNVKWSDLKLDLGVTGSLTPVGAPTATPVLQTIGTDYFIRGIETNKGVVSTLSAQNGVQVSCNFAQVGGGAEIIKDLNASQYEFKTLVGGENIAITQSDNELEISFVAGTTTTKTVIVSEESDFPDAVGGVITLESDTDYQIVNDITTSNRFIVGSPTVIRAASTQLVTLTYTGVDSMFTGSDPSLKIKGITVSCPNGKLLDITSGVPSSIFQMVESNIESCEEIGNIDGAFIVRFTNVAFEEVKTNGLTFSGSNLYLSINTVLGFFAAGTALDFGTSTFKSISISNGILEATAPGVTFLSGLPNSGNIDAGGLATVSNNKTFGVDTELSGISQKDTRWEFTANNNIPDSINDALVYTNSNALETVIAAANTPVKVNSVFAIEDVSRFTADGTGRVTYVGESASRLPIDITSTLLMAAGGDTQVSVYVAINGAVVAATAQQATASSTKAGSPTTIWQYTFQPNDYVEVWVENNDSTTNIIAQDVILRVN